MKFDLGIFIYLIFLAIILYSNHLKKRRQAQERSVRERRVEVSVPDLAVTPSTPMQSQLPDFNQWLDTLWGKNKPEPTPAATSAYKSLHDQRREKQLQARGVAASEETTRMLMVGEQALHGVGKRVPIDAARFKTREDLRRAIVARVVFAPPKSLE